MLVCEIDGGEACDAELVFEFIVLRDGCFCHFGFVLGLLREVKLDEYKGFGYDIFEFRFAENFLV